MIVNSFPPCLHRVVCVIFLALVYVLIKLFNYVGVDVELKHVKDTYTRFYVT
jgi:hypothetical protein